MSRLLLCLLAIPAPALGQMAFDADSTSAIYDCTPTCSGVFETTHTPAGTPRGAFTLIGQVEAATDDGLSVTYGGTSMTQECTQNDVSGTGYRVYGFFLGASIPTGAQTVAVTGMDNGRDYAQVTFTITAGDDTDRDATGTGEGPSDEPTFTIATTASTTTFVVGVISSDLGTLANIGPGANYSDESGATEVDFGTDTMSAIYRTSNPTGGNVSVDWTTGSSDDWAGCGIAVKEGSAAAMGPPDRMLRLFVSPGD